MTAAEWKRQRMETIRAKIRIEEAVLRSLRSELEELQWLNRRAVELRHGWETSLSTTEHERQAFFDECTATWLAGEHNLKA